MYAFRRIAVAKALHIAAAAATLIRVIHIALYAFKGYDNYTHGVTLRSLRCVPSSLSCRGGVTVLFVEFVVGATVGRGSGVVYLAIAKETGGL